MITTIGAFPFRHELSRVLIVRRTKLVIVHTTSDRFFNTQSPFIRFSFICEDEEVVIGTIDSVTSQSGVQLLPYRKRTPR